MATYKVLQDIEAEDKLVGPFSLRQFIYAIIAVLAAFVGYKLAKVSIFLIIPFAPVVVLFGVLSAPFGHDQPSEIWLLARVRFFLKPHKRIWSQSGMVNLVTITVPKKVQRNLTNNLSQSEVSSRLQALANTIDSRGWAVKNVNVNLYNQSASTQIDADSDRLVDPSSLPQDVPAADVTAADDILDPNSNPTAHNLDQMITTATVQHHQEVVNMMNHPEQPNSDTPQTPDYWFMNNAPTQTKVREGYASFADDKVVTPGEDPSSYSPVLQPGQDKAILEELERRKESQPNINGHMKVIQPLDEQVELKNHRIKTDDHQISPPDQKTITDPAIINLALANTDNWSIATDAREAERAQRKQPPQDEVVIPLH